MKVWTLEDIKTYLDKDGVRYTDDSGVFSYRHIEEFYWIPGFGFVLYDEIGLLPKEARNILALVKVPNDE